ncbi:MAG: COX15/CtaA family protein [Sulfuricaulis sp.]
MTLGPSTTSDKPVAVWLLICAAFIFAMVVLGGVTRLTHSGLSIVQWDPIVGAVPPFRQSQWEQVFDLYKQTPEYRQVNAGISLAQFKRIFFVEWAHRLLGRLIGVVFLVPFLYFLARRRITRALVPKLVTMFVLGGLQGALGWYMVKSGLVNIPRVSAYRLTAHLGLAIIIYAYIFWTALGLLHSSESLSIPAGLRRFATAVAVLIFLMILSGGFVAGTRAGFAFNTFPLMDGHLIPEGLLAMQPAWVNPFENIVTVQFDHRCIACLLCLTIPVFWWSARRAALPSRARLAIHLLLAWLAVQVTLGITTLLYVVPVPLAAAHQAGAVVLFSVALFVRHTLRSKS